jgi:hypothetical protein
MPLGYNRIAYKTIQPGFQTAYAAPGLSHSPSSPVQLQAPGLKMKVFSCLTALLSFAAAITIPPSPKPPLGGRQITDPIILAELQAQHAHTLSKMKHGEKILVHLDELANYEHDPLQKRLFVIFGLAGAAIVEAIGAGADIIGGIIANLLSVFLGDDHTIWHDHDHCRTYFQTHAGSEGNFQTWNRGSQNADTEVNMK